jgi:methyl-CpG-binding domain protein 4
MFPVRSPFGLIQEDLWPNEFMILVSCMMLNCTSRKQVEKVLPEFMRRWPGPGDFIKADDSEVIALCKPLGFAKRRTANLKKMTEMYLATDWTHVRQFPGIGEYAARAWEIFCTGNLGDEPPKDHALVKYYWWAKKNWRIDGERQRKETSQT